jgi:hypothetical protein
MYGTSGEVTLQHRLPLYFTKKMEAADLSETHTVTYQSTLHHNPQRIPQQCKELLWRSYV